MNILQAMNDPALFGKCFPDRASWRAWEVFLAALFGLGLDGEDAAALFSRHTGRTAAPTQPPREAWVIVGRRGGKSRIAALVAVFLACFRSYADVLAIGEVGTLAVIAADRRQARVVMRYILGFLDAVPMLRAMVVAQTKETIELSNRVVLEVHTANFRAVRGYSLVGVVCDEIAFWGTDESGANPDTEILTGLRPGLATTGGLLLCISSPYARKGALFEARRKHFGQDGGPLVWQAGTLAMNPSVDPQVIEDALAEDEPAARAEWFAEFRRDIESYVSREAVDACVVPGRHELGPAAGLSYHGFVDPSGGSQDSMTVGIAHRDAKTGRAVLDCVRERQPPFSPDDVTAEFAAVLKAYGCFAVSGDRYGGEWPRERFRRHGVAYRLSEHPCSDLYRECLPLLSSGQVELLDQPRLIAQLIAVERRTARGGRDLISHPPRQHDDVINSAAGAIVLAARRGLYSGGMARLVGDI